MRRESTVNGPRVSADDELALSILRKLRLNDARDWFELGENDLAVEFHYVPVTDEEVALLRALWGLDDTDASRE